MDVSENSGTPKSSILVGVSIINHPFWGTPIFGNTHMCSALIVRCFVLPCLERFYCKLSFLLEDAEVQTHSDAPVASGPSGCSVEK